MRKSSIHYERRFDFSSPTTLLPVLLVCFFCWFLSFYFSVGYPVYGKVSDTPLWDTFCKSLPGKAAAYAIGMLLMIGGAMLLHRANYMLALIREKTLLPLLFYILFVSTNPDFFPLKPTSVGVFCLILAMYELFTSYHAPEATEKPFHAGMLIGIGSLLWVYLLWFLPLFWIGMYQFRTWTWRTFLASVLGVVTIYWFLLGWCVLTDDFMPFILSGHVLFKIRFLAIENLISWGWISILLIAVLSVVSYMNILSHGVDDSLRSRQYLAFLITMCIWAFVLYFCYEQVSEEFLETACIPASILIAHFFTIARGRYVPWIFYSIVALLVLIFLIRIWNF